MDPTAALLADLAAQQAPASHLERIAALVACARREPALRAVALVGSYAKGSGDRVSDLDLAAFVAPGCGARIAAEAWAVLGADPVLNRFDGRHARGGVFTKAVFLDCSSVELHVFEPDSPFRLRRPYRAVWDPSGLLEGFVVAGEPIRHEDFTAHEHGDAGLIWELMDCIKWLSRGRTGLARQHLVKLGRAIEREGGASG